MTTVTPDRPHGIKLHKVYLYAETYGDNGDTQPVLRDRGTAVTVNTGHKKYDAEVLHRDARVLRTTCNSLRLYAKTTVTTVTPGLQPTITTTPVPAFDS